jgi:glutathione peroxidase
MSVHDFSVETIQGETINLQEYEGKVLLIVNTASKCGFTPQFEGLQQLYETYHDNGFEVLGFPCNQFGNQDPGSNEEIEGFCQINYGVTFPMFQKIDVNGPNAHPLYKYLTSEAKGFLTKEIKWNFTKFLVDQNGNVVKRFPPQTTPDKIQKEIESQLKTR